MVAPLLPSEVNSNQTDLQQILKATQLVGRYWRKSPRCSGGGGACGSPQDHGSIVNAASYGACSQLAGFSFFTSVVFEFF